MSASTRLEAQRLGGFYGQSRTVPAKVVPTITYQPSTWVAKVGGGVPHRWATIVFRRSHFEIDFASRLPPMQFGTLLAV